MISLSALAAAPRLAPRLVLAAWIAGLALAAVRIHDAAIEGTARVLEAGLSAGSPPAAAAPAPAPLRGSAFPGDLAERPVAGGPERD